MDITVRRLIKEACCIRKCANDIRESQNVPLTVRLVQQIIRKESAFEIYQARKSTVYVSTSLESKIGLSFIKTQMNSR